MLLLLLPKRPNHLPLIVHPIDSYCPLLLIAASHCLQGLGTIALLQIIESVPETHATLVLHQGVESGGLRSLPSLLPGVEHFAPAVQIVDTALHVLSVRYCLILLARPDAWYVLVLTIRGSVEGALTHGLRNPPLIIILNRL